MNRSEVVAEINTIFADAAAGRDLPNISSRLSIATTKLDVLADELRDSTLRDAVKALDNVRSAISSDPLKAQYFVRAMGAITDGDLNGSQQHLDEYNVRRFLTDSGLLSQDET